MKNKPAVTGEEGGGIVYSGEREIQIIGWKISYKGVLYTMEKRVNILYLLYMEYSF